MILDLGTIDYGEALKLQYGLVDRRRSGEILDSALIVEHPPVFTIGRSGSIKNLLVEERYLNRQGISVIAVDRGGDITFHSPGQLVMYPIIDLRKRTKDLHKYLRDLEEAVINFLRFYGIEGGRAAKATGVWASGKKIASIGVAAKDWITYHGLSININNDTRFFSMINPCGIRGLKITSLKELLKKEIPMSSAKGVLLREFSRIFDFKNVKPVYEQSAAMA